MKKVVSACLVGVPCRYDGGHKKQQGIAQDEDIVAVCPEKLGGLSTPRAPAEQIGTKVITSEGDDVTKEFKEGAHTALEIALSNGCTQAVLKSKSPSCGCGEVYDGSFRGKLRNGDGVFTQLLKENGIHVITEEEFLDEHQS